SLGIMSLTNISRTRSMGSNSSLFEKEHSLMNASFFGPLGGQLRMAFVAAITAAGLVAGGNAVSQTITPEILIGDAVGNAGDPKYADVEKAISLYGNGDSMSARALLESARRKDEKLPPVDMMMAKLYLLSNQ